MIKIMKFKKDKTFIFYADGKELCNILVTPLNAHPFEVMVRRFLRYASRFGYNVRYESKEME